MTFKFNFPNIFYFLDKSATALHSGLSKYVTAEDTLSFKFHPKKSSRGSLLFIQPWSTIKLIKFLLSLVLILIQPRTRFSSEHGTIKLSVLSFFWPHTKKNCLEILGYFFQGNKLCPGLFSANSTIILFQKLNFLVLNVTFHLLRSWENYQSFTKCSLRFQECGIWIIIKTKSNLVVGDTKTEYNLVVGDTKME